MREYVGDMTGVEWEKTWQWLQKGDLEVRTEVLMCRAQEQPLITNCIKFQTDKKLKSPICRMCGRKGEINLSSEYSKQATRQ